MAQETSQAGLDCSTIAAAALEVAQRHGIAGLTADRVAAELGISERAFSRLVKTPAELAGLVVDAHAEQREGPPEDADWELLLRDAARGSRELAEICPGLYAYLLEHRVPTRAGRRHIERTLAALTDAGLPIDEAAELYFTYTGWIVHYLSVDPGSRARRVASGPAPAAATEEDLIDSRVLRLLAPQVSTRSDRGEFEAGVDLLVSAVAARIAARADGAAPV